MQAFGCRVGRSRQARRAAAHDHQVKHGIGLPDARRRPEDRAPIGALPQVADAPQHESAQHDLGQRPFSQKQPGQRRPVDPQQAAGAIGAQRDGIGPVGEEVQAAREFAVAVQ
ncbi:hypothetical protein G6F22_018273 [Rhizopus arrhizus]|nr:hypothetical protein G6F22_018273 [Rhizopus arrhizus]